MKHKKKLKMNSKMCDASTSPTQPHSPQPHQFYCTVTCCQNNDCKPSTILKSVYNPYFCPYREYDCNGVSNSCSFSGPLFVDQFYASSHGCFRRAVPTMPLFLAILLCIINLIIPGFGTFVASMAILFGCNTEYGVNQWFKAFFLCFISSLMQFISAIFVFGWVWSIMWGIVFIKNSLRYGSKRDLYTMSLC